MNRQQKIYASVLALALVALAVDRLFLAESSTGPQSAAAADDTSEPASASASGSGSSQPVQAGVAAAPSLANRLQNLAEQRRLILSDVPDAFRPNLSWVGTPKQAAAQAGGNTPRITMTEVEAFTSKHRLMAVLQNSDGGAAIVDNQTLVVGQVLDDFKMVSMTKRSVVFEKGKLRVELALPSPKLPLGD